MVHFMRDLSLDDGVLVVALGVDVQPELSAGGGDLRFDFLRAKKMPREVGNIPI